jgi:hypothetical protein
MSPDRCQMSQLSDVGNGTMTQFDVGCISSQQTASSGAPQNPHSRSRPVIEALYQHSTVRSPFRDHPPRAACSWHRAAACRLPFQFCRAAAAARLGSAALASSAACRRATNVCWTSAQHACIPAVRAGLARRRCAVHRRAVCVGCARALP